MANTEQAQTCVCGEHDASNTVHRTDGPCYQAERHVLTDDFTAFETWKGYALPPLNAEGRFDRDWMNREFIAFKAGRALLSTTPQVEAKEGWNK